MSTGSLERDSCGTKDPTRHQNSPSSRGGTNDDINISTVNEERHANFHMWASNKTPCQLARQIALHSMGNGDKSVGAETVYAMIRATTVREWAHHYRERAISLSVDVQDIHSVVGPKVQLRTQSLEELTWTLHTIYALRGEGPFPVENHQFLPKALDFFNTNSPRAAIEALLTEKSGKEHLWTKPLKYDEREYMMNALKAPEGFIPASRTFNMTRILSRHATTLDKFQESMRLMHEQYERFMANLTGEAGAA